MLALAAALAALQVASPCQDPAQALRCPDLVMAPPSHLSIARSPSRRRVLLRMENRIVNLGSGSGSSVHEVLQTVHAVTGSDVPVVEAPRRPGDPPVLIASNDRAAALLGWRPTLSLRAMVEDAWEFHNATN